MKIKTMVIDFLWWLSIMHLTNNKKPRNGILGIPSLKFRHVVNILMCASITICLMFPLALLFKILLSYLACSHIWPNLSWIIAILVTTKKLEMVLKKDLTKSGYKPNMMYKFFNHFSIYLATNQKIYIMKILF